MLGSNPSAFPVVRAGEGRSLKTSSLPHLTPMNLPRAESLEATASVFLLAWLLVFFAWRKLYRHYWGLAAVILVDMANRLLWFGETLVAFSPGHFHFYAWGYYVLDVLELAALTLCVYQLARAPGSRS